MSLIDLREKYKKRLEVELRENQMKGINFVIDKCMNELFDEFIKDYEIHYTAGTTVNGMCVNCGNPPR